MKLQPNQQLLVELLVASEKVIKGADRVIAEKENERQELLAKKRANEQSAEKINGAPDNQAKSELEKLAVSAKTVLSDISAVDAQIATSQADKKAAQTAQEGYKKELKHEVEDSLSINEPKMSDAQIEAAIEFYSSRESNRSVQNSPSNSRSNSPSGSPRKEGNSLLGSVAHAFGWNKNKRVSESALLFPAEQQRLLAKTTIAASEDERRKSSPKMTASSTSTD